MFVLAVVLSVLLLLETLPSAAAGLTRAHDAPAARSTLPFHCLMVLSARAELPSAGASRFLLLSDRAKAD
jgi:hypothetical protein